MTLTSGVRKRLCLTLAAKADKLTVRDGAAALCPAASFPNADSIKQSFMDWTGFECFANKIHIEDFSIGMDAVEMLGQAIGFSKLIQQKVDPLSLPLRPSATSSLRGEGSRQQQAGEPGCPKPPLRCHQLRGRRRRAIPRSLGDK